jgi:hypothetical protein
MLRRLLHALAASLCKKCNTYYPALLKQGRAQVAFAEPTNVSELRQAEVPAKHPKKTGL